MLVKSKCNSNDACAWVKKHAGRGGKEIPSACRGVRRSLKSPKAKSACRLLRSLDCKVNSSCAWVKKHVGRGGKVVPSLCRGVGRKLVRKSPAKRRVMSDMVKRRRKVSPKRRYSA